MPALQKTVEVPASFNSGTDAFEWIQQLVPKLQEQGYLAASVDSITVDNSVYKAWVYLGQQYRWAKVSFDSIAPALLTNANINTQRWTGQPLKPKQISQVSEKLLTWYENNGYPFAKVWLGSVSIDSAGGISGTFMTDKGPFRKLDSIVVHGNVVISKNFLVRYLDIEEGTPYNESKFDKLSTRLAELPYLEEVQPWDVAFKLTDTKLNLYLNERKANRLNAIVGLLPNNVETGKFLLTVDALLAFQNILSAGESISVSYQNLQYRSPRLVADVVWPYILGTPFGIDAHFDLFKRDTSFRRTSFQAGVRYQLNAYSYIRAFYQNQSNRLITIDTQYVRQFKRLPDNIDVSANGGGLETGIDKTDYRLNPRRGWQAKVSGSALLRQVRRSDAITQLSDGNGFDYAALYDSFDQRKYQYHLSGEFAYYIPVGKKATFRPAYNGGWISGQNLFKNELYQIGGFKLLRGFDEQSIYASQYHVLSLELRLLLDRNSYFYLFSDNGYVESHYLDNTTDDVYNGFGVGATLQTKTGLFTISYGLGRNSNTSLQFRQSKIHFGYVAYF